MYWRLVSFVVGQCLAALAGWWLAPDGDAEDGALMAMLLAAYAWVLLDALRGARLMRWLRDEPEAEPSLGSGLWGEASDRIRRLIRAQERLIAQSESRLHDFLAALQVSPNGVMLLDEQGRIEWFNQTSASHFGLSTPRDLLQHVGNLVREPGFVAYLAERDYRAGITMAGRENSSSKPVKLSVHIHPYGEGRSLLLSRDVTPLEQAEAMRRDFVANVSHEIRTPLTVLAGFVETMQTLPLDENERHRYLALMAQQSQRMQSLVNDLLTLSRLEGSPPPPAQEWVSVRGLMEQCEQDANDLSSVLWQRPHDLHVELQGEAEIAGAASELYSAMFNLVGNAVRYTPAAQRIDVAWRMLSDGGALFLVKDTGAGIAPEHIPRLTERFYRVDRSRSRETGGTGLGLAIVKHVSQRHGAELRIESVPGKGSTFSVQFPSHRVRLAHRPD